MKITIENDCLVFHHPAISDNADDDDNHWLANVNYMNKISHYSGKVKFFRNKYEDNIESKEEAIHIEKIEAILTGETITPTPAPTPVLSPIRNRKRIYYKWIDDDRWFEVWVSKNTVHVTCGIEWDHDTYDCHVTDEELTDLLQQLKDFYYSFKSAP